jgi:DNA-binding PadR family transcriptional regulator
MHGYEIHQELSNPRGLGLVWRLKQSHLYALLSRLEERGYVTFTLEPQESHPPRKVYALTDAGREALSAWVHSPVERGREFRIEFLAKLFFACREGEAAVGELLARQREACCNWLADQQTQAESLRDARPYEWLVCRFRMGQIQAMLDWLATCEQTLLGSEIKNQE